MSGAADEGDPRVDPDEIILDTGPCIALDRLDYATVLSRETDLLLSIPEPVARELSAKPDDPGGRLPARLQVRPIDGVEADQLRRQVGRPILGPGEIGVILAAERQWAGGGRPACAVIDDRDAWEFARARWGGVQRLAGSLSLIYLVHERQLQRRPLRQDVEVLMHSTHRLSEAQAARFIRYAEPLLQHAHATGVTPPAGEAWLRRIREAGMQRQSRQRSGEHGMSSRTVD